MSIIKNYNPLHFCTESQLDSMVINIQKIMNIKMDSVQIHDKTTLIFTHNNNTFYGILTYDIYRSVPMITLSAESIKNSNFSKDLDSLILTANNKLNQLYDRKGMSFQARTNMSFSFYENDFEGIFYVFAYKQFKKFTFTQRDLDFSNNFFLKFLCYKAVCDNISELTDYIELYDNIDKFIKIKEMIKS